MATQDKTNNLSIYLNNIHDVICNKKNYPLTKIINAQNFAQEIESIKTNPILQEKVVEPSSVAQRITPDSGYDGLSQVDIGAVNLQSQVAFPSTSEQTFTPQSGYIGFDSFTVRAISPTKDAQTYTPSRTNQTIPSGRWLTGAQTILGDANLLPQNIKKGVSIFNILGTLEGEPTITTRSYILTTDDVISFANSDATAQIILLAPAGTSSEVNALLNLNLYKTNGSSMTMTYGTLTPLLNAVCILKNGTIYTQTLKSEYAGGMTGYLNSYSNIDMIEIEAGSMSSPTIPLQIIEIK